MKLSLLVPFREDSSLTRTRTWEWLKVYWQTHLPGVEIIVGQDDGTPYSKSIAVNEAASRASGDVFAILDADTLLSAAVMQTAALAVYSARRPTWYIPHTRAYRLTREASLAYLMNGPRIPPLVRPKEWEVEDQMDNAPGFVQVLTRNAFDIVGGMDPRFVGWGGEDSSFMRAVDTLYAHHGRTDNFVLHLWHDRPGAGSSSTRRWDGQQNRVRTLSHSYRTATGNPRIMRALVDEGLEDK